MMPERFYLICERRDDGGLRVTSPEVVGLILSGADPLAVMRDVIPAIDAIMRHNTQPAHVIDLNNAQSDPNGKPMWIR